MNALQKTRTTYGAALCALALILSPAPAAAQEETVYGDDYGSGDFGRVRDAEQGVTLIRTDWEKAEGLQYEGLNAPIFPGDRLATNDDQRVEVELAGGSILRVDRRTNLTFLALPDPYAEFADNTVLQLADGRIRVSTALRKDEEFRIDTPAATIYPLGDADLRIEVNGQGQTRVFSRRGVAEVVGAGGSVLVRGGTRTDVAPGAIPYEPEPFNTFSGDGFDLWVEERDAFYERQFAAADSESYREIPEETQPYYRELSAYGTWADTSDYGWVWSPNDVTADWRPYYDGYWGYGPRGYFWVSNERWGWAPYHYGRWAWVGSLGWCWVPGRVFGGAWVSWSWGSAYIGWSPLDCWGYPAYRSVVYYGYYDPYAWTFVGYNHFHHHHYSHYSVSVNHIGDSLHHSAVVTRPPRVGPRELSRSVEARRSAVRAAREDVQSRIRRVARSDRQSPPTFRNVENRLARREGRDLSSRPGIGSRGSGPENARRRLAVTESRFPRRLSAGTAEHGRRSTGSVGPGRESPSVRGGTSRINRSPADRGNAGQPRVREVEGESRGGNDRLRDMYRKMARPRQTVEPRSDSSSPPSVGRGGRTTRPTPGRGTPRVDSRGDTRKVTPKAAPNPRSGTSRTTPKASPRSGSDSRRPAPKARPKPPSTRTDRGGSPSASRAPRTTPSPSARSRSAGSRPRPTVRSPRSSGTSKPRASTPRAGGQRAAPRASKPSTSGSRSRPKGSSSSSSRGRSSAGRRGSRR